ncbi:hypothetical protein KGO06_02200 [Patescibacteria group bacterium]|nr:hypothetical protein [Patescibacteria group bacterium]
MKRLLIAIGLLGALLIPSFAIAAPPTASECTMQALEKKGILCPAITVSATEGRPERTFVGAAIYEQGTCKCGYDTNGLIQYATPLRLNLEDILQTKEGDGKNKNTSNLNYNFNAPADDLATGASRKTSTDVVGAGVARKVEAEVKTPDTFCENLPIGFSFLCNLISSLFNLEFWWFILGTLVWMLFLVASMMLAVAVYMADGAIYYLVIHAGVILNNTIANDGILAAWALVRDLANLTIIAGFIAVGISTILDIAQYAASKFLARLIIAALLVNFSYFLTGAVIDASNYLSVAVYNSKLFINGCSGMKQERVLSSAGAALNTAAMGAWSGDMRQQTCLVAQAFYKETNMSSWSQIQKMALTASRTQTAPSEFGTTESRGYYFMLLVIGTMGLAFTVLLAFVMVNLAYMIIVRFIVLVVLLVTSPIGFAGINVPFLESAANRWWSALLGQAFFVPVMLFLLATGITILKGFNDMFKRMGSEQSFTSALIALQNAGADMGWAVAILPVFLTFALGVGFIGVALVIGRQITEQSDFKPFYAYAQNAAWATLRTPVTIPGGLLNGVTGLLNQSKLGAWLLKDERGFMGQMKNFIRIPYQLFAGGMRQATRLGEKPKEGEKGVFETMREEAKAGKEERAEKEMEKIVRSGPPEAQARVIESMDPDEAIDRFGINKLLELQEKGHLSSDYFKKLHESAKVSEADRKSITDARFSDIMRDFGRGNWSNAAEKIEALDETERKILFEERKELRNQKELLAQLKGKTFDEIADKRSDGKAMRGLRKEAMATRISAADDAGLRSLGSSLSNKDLLELNVDQVRKLGRAGALKASQFRHIMEESRDEAVKAYIRENHAEDLVGPGTPKPASAPPAQGSNPAS